MRGDFSYSPVKHRVMDDIDEHLFRLDATHADMPTADSNKSSVDSALVLSDSTREGSTDSARDSTSDSTFCSQLDKLKKCGKHKRTPDSEKLSKAYEFGDKDSKKESEMQREISCDSVLGESKTKLHVDAKASSEDVHNSGGSRKSDKVESCGETKEVENSVEKSAADKTRVNLVSPQVAATQCQTSEGQTVDEKPDLIVPDVQVEKHEQRLKSKQITMSKDDGIKGMKMREPESGVSDAKSTEPFSETQTTIGDKNLKHKCRLGSNQPDLLGECIKIEASKNSNEKNSATKTLNDSQGASEKPQVCEIETEPPEGNEEPVKTDDIVAAEESVPQTCEHENCTACLSGSTGRFVLPPPPRDRRVSACPGMPPIAEDTGAPRPPPAPTEDSCESGEDVFDSSTTSSSTYKPSRSATSSTSSGALGGVSSSGSGSSSSGEETSSPPPRARVSAAPAAPRHSADSSVKTTSTAAKGAGNEDDVDKDNVGDKGEQMSASASAIEARTLLDAMHKRYYPTMYRNKERSHSADSAHEWSDATSESRCSTQERKTQHLQVPCAQVPHSRSATFPSQQQQHLLRPTASNSHCRIIALDRLSDSAIQAKIDAMLTHPSQKPQKPSNVQASRVRKEDVISCLGLMSPKTKHKTEQGYTKAHKDPQTSEKPKSEQQSQLKPLSVLKSLSFSGITSPRLKHKSLKHSGGGGGALKTNPLKSLSPTFRRKKVPSQQQVTGDAVADSEDDELPVGPCQACVFIQVSEAPSDFRAH